MIKLKSWLQTANGWKRIWFVLTILGLMYSLYLSIYNNNQSHGGDYYFKNGIHKDFQKSECKPYSVEPIEKLKEPTLGENCYYIYLHRKYGLSKDVHPYTEEMYLKEVNSEYWGGLGILILMYSLITLVLSGILYFSGWVLFWITKGFRK